MRRSMMTLMLTAAALTVSAVAAPHQTSGSGKCATVLLGDSLFAHLRDNAEALAPAGKVCNLGLSGAKMAAITSQPLQPSAGIIFAEGGLNDLLDGADPASIVAAYGSLLAAQPRARILLVGVLPVDRPLMRPRYSAFATQEKIDRTNAGLASLCAEFPGCRVAEAVKGFSAIGKTTDGIHLGPEGREALARLMAEDAKRIALED